MRSLERVRKTFNARSLELRDAKVMAMDRQQWRDFANGINGSVNV